jgi:hypothetical protein
MAPPPVNNYVSDVYPQLEMLYKNVRADIGNLTYIDNFLATNSIIRDVDIAQSIKTSLLVDQQLDHFEEVVKYNDYLKLIQELEIFTQSVEAYSLSSLTIDASRIVGPVLNSQVSNLHAMQISGITQITYASDLGIIDPSNLGSFYASDIIGKFYNDQIDYIYKSKIVDLIITLHASMVKDKLQSSNIKEIDVGLISGLFVEDQIESIYTSQIIGLSSYQADASNLLGRLQTSQVDLSSVKASLIVDLPTGFSHQYILGHPSAITIYPGSTGTNPTEIVGSTDPTKMLEAFAKCDIWAYQGGVNYNSLSKQSAYYYSFPGMSGEGVPPYASVLAQNIVLDCYAILVGVDRCQTIFNYECNYNS